MFDLASAGEQWSHEARTELRYSAQAPPLNETADMPTLVQVVQGLESIVNGSHPSAA